MEARAKYLGTPILAPTVEAGLAPARIDTCSGVLKLQMWERRQDGTRGKVHVINHTNIKLGVVTFSFPVHAT